MSETKDRHYKCAVYTDGDVKVVPCDNIGPTADISDRGYTKDERIELAEFIVRACNSYKDLLDACKKWKQVLSSGWEIKAKGLPAEIEIGDAIELTKTALAKAKGD